MIKYLIHLCDRNVSARERIAISHSKEAGEMARNAKKNGTSQDVSMMEVIVARTPIAASVRMTWPS